MDLPLGPSREMDQPLEISSLFYKMTKMPLCKVRTLALSKPPLTRVATRVSSYPVGVQTPGTLPLPTYAGSFSTYLNFIFVCTGCFPVYILTFSWVGKK